MLLFFRMSSSAWDGATAREVLPVPPSLLPLPQDTLAVLPNRFAHYHKQEWGQHYLGALEGWLSLFQHTFKRALKRPTKISNESDWDLATLTSKWIMMVGIPVWPHQLPKPTRPPEPGGGGAAKKLVSIVTGTAAGANTQKSLLIWDYMALACNYYFSSWKRLFQANRPTQGTPFWSLRWL